MTYDRNAFTNGVIGFLVSLTIAVGGFIIVSTIYEAGKAQAYYTYQQSGACR